VFKDSGYSGWRVAQFLEKVFYLCCDMVPDYPRKWFKDERQEYFLLLLKLTLDS
jgi:hypothetical protein